MTTVQEIKVKPGEVHYTLGDRTFRAIRNRQNSWEWFLEEKVGDTWTQITGGPRWDASNKIRKQLDHLDDPATLSPAKEFKPPKPTTAPKALPTNPPPKIGWTHKAIDGGWLYTAPDGQAFKVCMETPYEWSGFEAQGLKRKIATRMPTRQAVLDELSYHLQGEEESPKLPEKPAVLKLTRLSPGIIGIQVFSEGESWVDTWVEEAQLQVELEIIERGLKRNGLTLGSTEPPYQIQEPTLTPTRRGR